MKVRIVSFLLGLAAAVVFWLVIDAGDRGSVPGDGGGGARSGPAAVRSPAAADGGGATAADGADGRRDAGAEREVAGEKGGSAVAGTLVVQADEVDQCLDVRGSVLVLENRSTGTTHRAVILENGGAAFEEVRFAPGRTEFALRTEVPDRACFPAEFAIARVELTGDPPAAGVSVALIHRHGLRGVVRDAETRRPIEGARVEVDAFEAIGAITDGEGRYALELPEPRGTLVLTAPGYQELLWRYPEETDAGTWLPDRRDFELLPDRLTAWVDLTATREDGSPAAGAEVEVEPLALRAPPAAALQGMSPAGRRRFLESLRADLDAFGPAAGRRDDLVEPLDETGRTALRLRLPGSFRIVVADPDRRGTAEVVVEAGGRVPVHVALRPSATLGLLVTEGEGPAAGARLVVVRDGLLPEFVSTDARGRATVRGLPPGASGRIEPRSGAPFELPGGAVPFALPASGGERTVRIAITPIELSPVRGEVVDATSGLAVGRATITAADPPRHAESDSFGRFELETRPGAALTARARDYRAATVVRAGDAPELAPIRLERLSRDPAETTATLRARVVDGAGAAVRGVPVEITYFVFGADPTDRVSRGMQVPASGPDGRLDPVGWGLAPPESVQVRLRALAAERTGFASVVLRAGDEREVDLVLRRNTTVSGVVWFDGSPAATGGVEVVLAQGGLGERRTETRADGTFEFADVPAGAGVLRARLPFRAAEREVEIPEAGLKDVVLRLEPSDEP